MSISLERRLTSGREEDIQSYLTLNPDILVGALGWPRLYIAGGPDNAGCAAFCLPKMRFGNQYVSDFVVVVCRSLELEISLVELEPATAKPFTKAGTFGQRLNGAIKQVNDWFAWLDRDANWAYFKHSLQDKIIQSWTSGVSHIPIAGIEPVLHADTEWCFAKIIIGRRSMMSQGDNRRRAAFHKRTGGRIEIIPYDRLLLAEKTLQKLGINGLRGKLRAEWQRERRK